MKKICPICGGEFNADRECQKYCSDACRFKAFRANNERNRQPREKVCKWCERKFTGTWQAFCSAECKNEWNKAKSDCGCKHWANMVDGIRESDHVRIATRRREVFARMRKWDMMRKEGLI